MIANTSKLDIQKMQFRQVRLPYILLIKSSIPCNQPGSLPCAVTHNTLLYKNEIYQNTLPTIPKRRHFSSINNTIKYQLYIVGQNNPKNEKLKTDSRKMKIYI